MQKFKVSALVFAISLSLIACGSENTNTSNVSPTINIINEITKSADENTDENPETQESPDTQESPKSEPSLEPPEPDSDQPTVEPTPTSLEQPVIENKQETECLYRPDQNGFLNVPLPDGGDRVLKPGEYELIDNGKAVRVTKTNQVDTGKVTTINCDNSNDSDLLNFCDKFPVREDGSIMVPYNGNVRWLGRNEFSLMEDMRSVRVTKEGAPDVGKVITPPVCPN